MFGKRFLSAAVLALTACCLAVVALASAGGSNERVSATIPVATHDVPSPPAGGVPRKTPPPDFRKASRRRINAKRATTVAGQTPPAQQCDIAYQRYGACYDYAGGTVSEANQGATVSFPVNSATLAAHGGHTLMEMAVFNRTAAGIDQDTAEVGWTVDPSPSGQPPVPHLFVYHFVNTAGTCYNGCGFVSTSTKIVPGMALKPGMDVTWSIRNIGGNWTFFFNGTEFGYIPDSAYDGTFNQASMVNVYGEIAGGGTTPTCSQMGNGLYGSEPAAATISNFHLNDAASDAQLVPYWPTDPAAWDSAVTRSGFRIGGPGDCKPMAGTVATADDGYTVVGQDTSAYPFTQGDNAWGRPTPSPSPHDAGAGQIVGVATDPATGGYWMTDDQGDVYAVNAPSYGTLNGTQTAAPVVGITAFQSGYLLVTANGNVYSFNASSHGDLGATRLSSPVVGITAFRSGYLLATASGRVYSFNAPRYGGLRSVRSPVTGIAADGNGYLLVDASGDVYPFHTSFHGSLRGTPIPKPIIGITPTTSGYLLTDAIGNVYAFGTPFDGSVTNEGL